MPHRILAYGCSFVYGLNRVQGFVGRTGIDQKCESFTEIIASDLNIPHQNHALSGSSNYTIASKILSNSDIRPTDYVFVGWTGLFRLGNWDTHTQQYINGENQHDFSMTEYVYHTELMIRSVNDYLTSRGCNYNMISSLYDYKQSPRLENISDWQHFNWIKPDQLNNSIMDIVTDNWLNPDTSLSMSTSDYQDQNNWHTEHKIKVSVDKTYPYLSECMHPNQAGHEKIADVIINDLNI